MSGKGTPLHGDETVIDHGLLGEAGEKGYEVGKTARVRDEKA